MQTFEFEVVELTQQDSAEISGGSFGHDAGVALRFLGMYAIYGQTAAIVDYAVNKVKCGC